MEGKTPIVDFVEGLPKPHQQKEESEPKRKQPESGLPTPLGRKQKRVCISRLRSDDPVRTEEQICHGRDMPLPVAPRANAH
ncbi:hypothetical protein [Pseudorhodoplanes sp.]|uniref:hypothetical protein n=1 Tax=Pseudorhodoplanes sp. TaxID=1934341 RepID=UPI00391DB194